MKKHARLLCAILVVAVLASSLAFVVGAEGEDAFTKSFEVTNFGGNKISDGSLVTSEVEGNRVTSVETMNPTHSPYISVGKVDGKNPYVVTYINKTESGEAMADGNNLSISVNTGISDAFKVVGSDAKGYYVIDLDVATHGYTIPEVFISVVMRRALDGNGYPFSENIKIGGYVTEGNAWAHLTIVGDIANNVAKVYVDGNYVGDAGKAVKTDNDKNVLASDTEVTARGYRVEISKNDTAYSVTEGENYAFDNFAHRLYIEDGAAITEAIADGDITDWEGYTNGRSGEKLPTLATVNGVEYSNVKILESLLSTNDTMNVEFKALPFGPVKITANATINTNGMPKDELITLGSTCTIKSEKGNIVTTQAPFVSNITDKSIKGTVNTVVRASNPDNQLGAADGQYGLWYVGYNVANMRGTFLVTDTYTGHKYIRDTVYSGTVPKDANTYIDWHTGNDSVNMAYKLGVDQHIIFDIDFALITRGTHININPITRTSGGSGVWGNTSAYFDDIFTAAGIPDGEFAHVTAVVTVDTRVMTIFVNGKYVMTVENSISTNAEGHYCNGIRTFSSSDATAGYANVSLRCVQNADLTAAVNAQDITLWSGNLYNEDYEMTKTAAKATIDGVPYYSEADMEAALYGNKSKPAVVKILHVFDEEITVNCDANIYTYGQDVKFVDVNGNALVPESNGIIVLDIPYMQNREEAQLTVEGEGLVNMPNVYEAVKADVSGNIFNSFAISSGAAGIWGSVGYRGASLITNVDTGDVFYRESARPNTDGTMNSGGNQYANMQFNSIELTYEEGKNEYIVADFDFGTDALIDDDISVQLIPRGTNGGAWANNICLNAIGISSGEMAHVTIVFDFTNNYAHVFVDGIYITSVEEGAMDDDNCTGTNANTWTDEYLTGSVFTVSELKLCSNQKTGTVCFDNVLIRAYDLDADKDGIDKAVSAMDITKWVDSVYTENYEGSQLPAVASIDGVDYGSIYALNEALAKESVYSKTVVIKHTPSAAVKICNDATVETNALEVTIDSNTGAYEFDPGIPAYRSTSTGLAYATSRLLKSVVGTVYSFSTISAENCMNSATAVVWTYDADFKSYDVVFYAYGDTIAPLDGGEYIKGTTFYREQWAEMHLEDEGFVIGDIITAFPVASPITATQFYLFSPYTKEAPFAATDLRYGAKIDTNIAFTLYVNKAQTATVGEIVTIDGVEYVAITYYLAPNEIEKTITATFEVVDENGVTYIQKQSISFVEYAEALLTTFGTEEDKALTVAFLDYANAAHALFDKNGAKMNSVTALVEAYASYLPANELTEKLDTSMLAPYIRSAAMKLDSAPSFIFKVARGFVGTIEFSYDHLGTVSTVSIDVDASDVEKLIALDTFVVFDLCSDITVTVTTGDVTVSGSYNLASYAQGLEDNAFAVALYNYAKVALAYKMGSTHFATPEI